MGKQYLLTYQEDGCGKGTFAWFETEEELTHFIDNNKLHVLEALKIYSCEEVEI